VLVTVKVTMLVLAGFLGLDGVVHGGIHGPRVGWLCILVLWAGVCGSMRVWLWGSRGV